MKFLHERQTRRFYFFLAAALALQTGVLGLLSILQVRNIREFLAKRELAAVSYLLEQDIPPETVFAAWNGTEVTEEGMDLLRMIGHTGQGRGYFLLLMEQTSVWLFLPLVSAGAGLAVVILAGAAVYFRRRERIYEDRKSFV